MLMDVSETPLLSGVVEHSGCSAEHSRSQQRATSQSGVRPSSVAKTPCVTDACPSQQDHGNYWMGYHTTAIPNNKAGSSILVLAVFE